MTNLRPTLLKLILTILLFGAGIFNFLTRYLHRESICKIGCTYPNCPPCAYPTSPAEIALWGVIAVLLPLLFYLIYSLFQNRK